MDAVHKRKMFPFLRNYLTPATLIPVLSLYLAIGFHIQLSVLNFPGLPHILQENEGTETQTILLTIKDPRGSNPPMLTPVQGPCFTPLDFS